MLPPIESVDDKTQFSVFLSENRHVVPYRLLVFAVSDIKFGI